MAINRDRQLTPTFGLPQSKAVTGNSPQVAQTQDPSQVVSETPVTDTQIASQDVAVLASPRPTTDALPTPVADAAAAVASAEISPASVSGAELDAFNNGQLPATGLSSTEKTALTQRLQALPDRLNQMGQRLGELMNDRYHAEARRRGERLDIPAQRQQLSTELTAQRSELQAQLQKLDPAADAALVTDLQNSLTQIDQMQGLIDQAGTLDQARRSLLDADYGMGRNGRALPDATLRPEIEGRLNTVEQEAARYEERLAQSSLPESAVSALREPAALVRRDARQFREFIFDSNPDTIRLMDQLGRNGRTLSSRFQNYHGYIDKRLDGNRAGRAQERQPEIFNVSGYFNSLRHDLSDARSFARQFSGVVGEMERRATGANPMTREELSGRIRSIYSTESGDAFVRAGVIGSTFNVAEARRLAQQAERQITAAERSLGEAAANLGEATNQRDREFFDVARARVADARSGVTAGRGQIDAARSSVAQSNQLNQQPLDGNLPPEMQGSLRGTQTGTSDRNRVTGGRIEAANREAGRIETDATRTSGSIDQAEQAREQRLLEEARRATGTTRPEDERLGETLGPLLSRLMNNTAGEASASVMVSGGVGNNALNATVGAGFTLIANRHQEAAGPPITVGVNLDFRAAATLDVKFVRMQASIQHSFQRGLGFRDEKEVAQFGILLNRFMTSVQNPIGNESRVEQDYQALMDFASPRVFRGESTVRRVEVGVGGSSGLSGSVQRTDSEGVYPMRADDGKFYDIGLSEDDRVFEGSINGVGLRIQRLASTTVSTAGHPGQSTGTLNQTLIEFQMPPGLLNRGGDLSSVIGAQVREGLAQVGGTNLSSRAIDRAIDAANGRARSMNLGSSATFGVDLLDKNGDGRFDEAYIVVGMAAEGEVKQGASNGLVYGEVRGSFNVRGRARIATIPLE